MALKGGLGMWFLTGAYERAASPLHPTFHSKVSIQTPSPISSLKSISSVAEVLKFKWLLVLCC
jgi:hypothetical protein